MYYKVYPTEGRLGHKPKLNDATKTQVGKNGKQIIASTQEHNPHISETSSVEQAQAH